MAVGEIDGVECLGEGTDLVHLHENGVCRGEVDALLEEFHVRDEKIVADELRGGAELVGEHLPAVPVVFGAAVFDGDDRILLLQTGVVGHELGGGQLALVALLEDVFFLLLVEELGGSDVEGEGDVFAELVTGFFDSLGDDFQRVVGALERRGEATFVTDGGVQAHVVQDLLQRVEDFRAVAERFREGRGADGHDHEFLEIDRSIGVRATIDDVHHRHGKHFGVRATDVFIKRLAHLRGGGFGDGEGGTEDGVRTQFGLRGRAVDLQHGLVETDLIAGVTTDERVGDRAVHGGDGFLHALAEETLLVAIAQFEGFVLARGGAGGDRRAAECAAFEEDVHFDSGIAAGINDFAPDDGGDGEVLHDDGII